MRAVRVAALLAPLLLVPLAPLGGARAADAPGFKSCADRYKLTGLPSMRKLPIGLCRPGYAVAFDPETRAPDWVIERLPRAQITGNAQRKNNFHPDPDVDSAIADKGPQLDDYKGSGFDRGHQAPAGDFASSQPMTDESFLLTNMSPQVGPRYNQAIWRVLETDIRRWIACGDRPELYVVTGPVYTKAKERWLPKDGKDNNGRKDKRVRVADAFFKVIYDPTNKRALGMMLPMPDDGLDTRSLPTYAVAIDDIEEATGIVFFPKMSKRMQTVLKSSAGNLWGTNSSCTADVDE
ncbi:MAG: DNA/RNA non-specific endonuclease [Alphaproteobacteria bacterium]|nr:DNA/RNA non-specific endonuclease [Alphaproteobacteria bacterium]